MIEISEQLNEEINEIKGRSFPELVIVPVTGLYVPDCLLLPRRMAEVHTHLRKRFDGERLASIEGYAGINLIELLSQEKYSSARAGAIVHELSHVIAKRTASEREIDEIVLSRGYRNALSSLAMLSEKINSRGRKGISYTFQELRR